MKRNFIYLFIFFFSFLSNSHYLNAQTKEERQKIIKEKVITKTNVKELRTLNKEFNQKFKEEKEKAVKLAQKNGWIIKEEKNGRLIELMKISKDGTPIYYTTFNANSAISTRANTLHNGGILGLDLEGQGMTAHVWDGGLARSTHQEYDGVGGTDRFSIGDSTEALHYHSAHVTGTLIASGVQETAKGMAPQAYAIGYDWNNDLSEVAIAASTGMLLSNHSYGWDATSIDDWVFGAYTADSRDWDEVMYNAPYYLMCVAGGNDGDNNTANGAPLAGDPYYDKLSGHATAKNNLVVANAQSIGIDTQGNLVSLSINTSSSEGPTDDLRIKPDITGNGTALYSSVETSNSAYNTLTGTSMASPNVCGTLLLLQQHYNDLNSNFMKAATLKGLALHTADDAGISGPDPIFGWGLLNGKKAAQVITDRFNGTVINELNLNQSQTYTIDVLAAGTEDIEVSISWTDIPGSINEGTANVTTPVLVNDLDLRITEGSNTYYPYRLISSTANDNGDNIVDPFEKIVISSPTAGTKYTIQVSHKGTLLTNQDYSLIITGIENSSVNSFTTTSSDPNQINLTWNKNSNDDDVMIAWSSDGDFGDPVNQTSYATNDAISGGGTVLYKGNLTSFNHSSLSENTQYYYKIWSVLPTGNYSAGSYSDEITIKSTSSNYPTAFSTGNVIGTVIPLTWTDAIGTVIPDGYLIKASTVGYNDITAPINGTTELEGRLIKNIAYGTETVAFDSLIGLTSYYFKIYPYTNSGINIKYKTDGTTPEAYTQTDVDPCAGISLPYSEDFDSGDNCWNGITGNDDWINVTPTTPAGDHTGGGTCFVTNGNNDYSTNSIYNLISPNISLNGFEDCELTFWLYMNAEPSGSGDYWDGGYLECFDGTSWTKVTTSLPYVGTLHAGNPLGEELGWSPSSITNWTEVTVDLSAYDENPDFQIRFRFGSDGASVAPGWAIDDISITGTTTCIPPADQATDFATSAVTYNSMNVEWTRGTPFGGDNILVVAKEASAVKTYPTKGNSYTANAVFGNGSEIGTGNYVVYKGIGTNVNITGLTNITTYDFSIYEFSSSDNCYNLIDLSGSATTEAKPVATNHVTNFTAGSPSPIEIPLSWINATGGVEPDAYVILVNTNGTFSNPVNGTPVSDDTNLGDGSGAINLEQNIQSYTFTGLDFATAYYFKIYPYTNSGNSIIYKTDGTIPTDNATTLINPCSGDIIDLPYEKDFSNGQMPLCWDIFDNDGSGQVWQFGTISGVTFGTGNYAYLDSDGYGLTNSQNSDLVTHTFDFSDFVDVNLSFTHYYKHVTSKSSATVSYSLNNGASWIEIQQWTASTSNPDYFDQIMNDLDGQSEVKFKFNYIGQFSWYWLIDDFNVSGTRTCTPPTNQSTSFNSTTQTENSIAIEWNRGTPSGGDQVIVLAREGGAVSSDPISGTTYTANSVFGSGSLIGTDNYVVYTGIGENLTVTNLSGTTDCHFAIYEYNASSNCYLRPGLTGNATTNAKAEPTNHVTLFAAGNPTASEIPLTWIDATGGIVPDSYLILANTTGNFNNPTDLNPVSDDISLSDGSGAKNIVKGVQAYTFTGLDFGVKYYFKIYPYSNSGTLVNYKTNGTPAEVNKTTFSNPCAVDLSVAAYSEDFDALTTPAIPACASIENTNNDSYTWITATSDPKSSPNHLSIRYNGSEEMDDWFFSAPLLLESGYEYAVSYWYRAESSYYAERLELKLGTSNNSTSMSLGQLFDDNSITSTTYIQGQATFTVATDGIYYLGWHGYSLTDKYNLYIDDISVTKGGTANFTADADDGNNGTIDDEFTVNESEKLNQFENFKINVYPNPADDFIYIEFANVSNEPMKIEIYNIHGQKLYHQEINALYNADRHQVDVSNYTKGMYFIKVYNSNCSKVEKINLR
ncbi:MAG: S8 family serine peptidase [Bacteroidales bacterium]|nr:S8 family serine peptidase [Bacteroidales bacterium]